VKEGAARSLYGCRKRRWARARALPEAEAAKPGGASTTTEIISYIPHLWYLRILIIKRWYIRILVTF
jgi:hypothetical protein